ncbi:hypothetical protein TDB9533_03320 [Thalassocella blandensis]|nr:hypothetical protein TDB9533_03320 [Thalassocella blandensis]
MLPDLLLKERRPYKRNEIGNIKPVAISSKGVVAGVELYDATKYFLIKGDGINLQINDNNSEDIDAIHLYNEWIIIITTLSNTLSVNLHADPKLHNKSPVKTLRFPGTTSVNIRFTDKPCRWPNSHYGLKFWRYSVRFYGLKTEIAE